MRLIDADALREQCDDPFWCVWLSDIDHAPTIDAVPVVRCKDCKQYKTIFTWNGNEYKSCELNPHGDGDWFCADGERKDNE